MKSLFNEQATGDQIREIFVDILQDESKIKPKDRVIIYYSGHGKVRTLFGRDSQEIKEGYIVPYDSKREKFGSNIPMNTIIEGCQKCPAKHVLLILDCCYSGFAANREIRSSQRSHVATEDYIRDISSRSAVQIFAAGQEDQPVSDSGIHPGYSAFTGALLDILEPGADLDDDGILTASEIGNSLERQVAIQGGSSYQRPVYSPIAGSRGGDLIFKIFKLKKPTTAPIVQNKNIETIYDTPVEILLTTNNLDPDDIARFSIINAPEHGKVKSGIADNSFVYTPNAGFAGEDTFTYKATNSQEVDSNIATIDITIKPHPSPTSTYYSSESNVVAPGIPSPQETNKKYKRQRQQSQLFGNPKVFVPIIAVIGAAVIGLVVYEIWFQPHPYSSPQPSSNASASNINSEPTSNHPPIATDLSVTTKQNTPISITLAGSDLDQNSTLTAKIVTPPSHGTLSTINQDTGTVTYTPNPGFTGSDIFRFKVNDGKVNSSNNGTIIVAVKQNLSVPVPQISSSIHPNHPPIATDLSVTTKQNTPVSITLAGSDLDQNSTLTAKIVTPPSHGTLSTINQDTGTVTYTPNPGFTGSDIFRFKVNDGSADSINTSIVKIKVNT